MMTFIEYQSGLARVLELVAVDPAPDTPDGRELVKLADALMAYELENFGDMAAGHAGHQVSRLRGAATVAPTRRWRPGQRAER